MNNTIFIFLLTSTTVIVEVLKNFKIVFEFLIEVFKYILTPFQSNLGCKTRI